MTATDVHEIRHGYNLADLDRLAHAAIWRHWMTSIPLQDRRDLAWSAIAEHLCTAETRPEPVDLIRAAEDAISRTRYDDWHHQGYDYNKQDGRAMGRFVAYWTGLGVTPDFGPAIIDRTALWQIWPHLNDNHRRALLALATHGDYHAAADALGLTYKAYTMLLVRARRAFFTLWHEGEAPSRPWGTDRRQGSKDRSVAGLVRARERRRAERAA
ncbi:hypothetical protein [Actinomadura sediminis]|uniref:Sigma-70 family RNA polymerase sigma factor n=1 Tax=Actinomadura sediminis TaxID=1038904 RepID=A0ABW3EUG6_9ACTN